MIRTIRVLLTLALIGLGPACWAADNLAVGKWDCVSKAETGPEQTWTLSIKEDAGKLSGTLKDWQGEIPLVDPKLEGNTLTFKIDVNPNCQAGFKATIEGNKLDGKFSCPEASGTLKGTRQS
jgi:hypothetical protein